jgi:hypothetical protein
MSLVAALAVAGLSSTASAGSLEEAIKGVSISGKMEVEYENHDEDTNGVESSTLNGNGNNWDYDIDVKAKIPVNDNITAVVGLQADDETSVEASPAGDNGDAQVDVSELNFVYTNGPVTAIIGKQGMAGAPWFDDAKAHGVVGLYNAGVVTLAAAHFTGVNSTVGVNNDVAAAAVIGSMGPVNAQLWYADISNVADSVVIEADATFDIVNISAKYGVADYTDDVVGAGNDDDAEMLQAVVSVDFGVATPYIGYGATDSEQAGAGLDLEGGDSRMDFDGEILGIDDLDDADAFLIGVTVPMNEWKFELYHIVGEYDNASNEDCDFDETTLDIEYKMSKNFTIDTYYSTADFETSPSTSVDSDTFEIALEYKF